MTGGKHPNRIKAVTKHGLSRTREYNKFAQAKSRCQCPTNKRYKDYGGRGIEFRFASIADAVKYLGPCPSDKTLDRYPNPDGHYAPGNVRWATWAEQWETRRPWNWNTASYSKYRHVTFDNRPKRQRRWIVAIDGKYRGSFVTEDEAGAWAKACVDNLYGSGQAKDGCP